MRVVTGVSRVGYRAHRKVLVLIALSSCFAALLFVAPTASAQTAYSFSNSFDTHQSVGGPTATGLAVDNSTNPLDPSAGDFYVTGGQVVNVFTPAGAAAGQNTPMLN